MGATTNPGWSWSSLVLSTPASLWCTAHFPHHLGLFLDFNRQAIARCLRLWGPGYRHSSLWWLYRLPGTQPDQFGDSNTVGRSILDRLWILCCERYVFYVAPHSPLHQVCLWLGCRPVRS